jgi:hypothetical protein
MRIRDELGSPFDDARFISVYAHEGQPALHPWQLALVSVMSFTENISDRQAANAVRARIDWEYALGLDLAEVGFHNRLARSSGHAWARCGREWAGSEVGTGAPPSCAPKGKAALRQRHWGHE